MTTSLPPLIGLIGKKRVGKDTFAAVLVEEFGFARVAFADPLKEMALAIDPILTEQPAPNAAWSPMRLTPAVMMDGWERVKDDFPEARRFLQRLGDGVRQFDPEFWVRAGMDAAAREGGQSPFSKHVTGKPVVITDVRYPNEADAIREAGGTLVRIVRPGVDDNDTHASETALDGYATQWTYDNDGSVAWLQERARWFAEYLSE